MELGTIGIWRRHQVGLEGVAEIEAAGFGTLWLGSSPSLEQVRPFLERSSAITVATGILNVWMHTPEETAAEHARLTAAHGKRFLCGLGISHRPLIDRVNPGRHLRQADRDHVELPGRARCRFAAAGS